MHKKLTISDIAEIAQVSKGTVSKILNNRGGVGEDTRKRVLELVERLEFTPNSSAQALAFNKTFNIGFIVPHEAEVSLDAFYWSTLIAAVAGESALHDYNLVLFTPKDSASLALVYDRIIQTGKVDGLVVGAEQFDAVCLAKLRQSGIPFVLIGQSVHGISQYVDVDNQEAAERMTEYMVANGYGRIAYLGGPLSYEYAQSRLAGFEQIARKNHIEYGIESLASYNRDEARLALGRIFRDGFRPEALFLGAGGELIFDVLSILEEMGYKGRLTMTVFDDYPFLDYIATPMTALRQPLGEMGRRAVSMLLELMVDSAARPGPVVLPAALVIRK